MREASPFRAGKLSWGLRLDAWGYGEGLVPVGRAVPQANEHRVEYRRSGLTEWYVNGPMGIEQGFTVSSPPQGTSSGEALTVRLAWSGEVRIQVEQSTAVVSNLAGEPVLRYSGLCAHDAAGKGLRAWLEQRGTALLLRVDDREATYPVVIDPFIQQKKLIASGGAAKDYFGDLVCLSADGNTALIGACGVNAEQGAAYVFVRSGETWSELQKLTASDGTKGDDFGISVWLSSDGNTALIGACLATVGTNTGQGAAYVFVNSGGTWTQQQKLTASDGAASDNFGLTVTLGGEDGNTALVSASATVGANAAQGAAYVFTRSGTTWSQQAKLTSSDGAANDYFGWSLSLSTDGNTALIGSYKDNTVQGAAYLFANSNSTWSQQQEFTASDGAAGDAFGESVSLSGDGNTALIGAYYATVNGHNGQGATYVLVNSGGTWSQEKLTAADGAANDYFGWSLSLSADGDTALIGSLGIDKLRGAAYVFVNSGGTWDQQKLIASDGATDDEFGYSVSLSGDGSTSLVGAFNATVAGHKGHGAAYIYAASSGIAYSVSGTVTNEGSGLSGVTMNLKGASTLSTTTDSNGNYTFFGVSKGMYEITPSLTGYIFTPKSLKADVTGDLKGQNFTGVTSPGAPTIGTVTGGNATASVSFTAPSSNGGSKIIHYTVTRYIKGKAAGNTIAVVTSQSATPNPVTVKGLKNGNTYTFTVTATNAAGTSAASGFSSPVTPAE